MKLIQRKSFAAAKAILNKHGLVMPDAVIEEMLVAASDRPTAEYEVGDFVRFSEGMGETGYGTVIRVMGDDTWTGYHIAVHGAVPDDEGYYRGHDTFGVTAGDVHGLATVKEAEDYIRLRSMA